MSDRGYDEIYGSNSYIREAGIIIMLIVITVIISSGYYIEEEQSGVDRLIKCSESGIAKVYNMKLYILSAVITGVSVLFIFIDMFLWLSFMDLNISMHRWYLLHLWKAELE